MNRCKMSSLSPPLRFQHFFFFCRSLSDIFCKLIRNISQRIHLFNNNNRGTPVKFLQTGLVNFLRIFELLNKLINRYTALAIFSITIGNEYQLVEWGLCNVHIIQIINENKSFKMIWSISEPWWGLNKISVRIKRAKGFNVSLHLW